MHASRVQITPSNGRFSHEDARRAHQLAVRNYDAPLVVIDLTRADDATTSAFAQLVVLRRHLLRCGRDLRLHGLHDRVAHLYQINRLGGVLPVQ